MPPFRRIAIAAHPRLPEAVEVGNQIVSYLKAHGATAHFGVLHDEDLAARVRNGEFDLMIALGGDGTILRAGNICGPARVPVLGINLGRFGFLMEVQEDQWLEIMPRLLQGNYRLERRMMLCAELLHAGETAAKWEVLNEVVVGRGHMVRPVHLITEVDGRYLTTYVADALIAATPTGSTAYALAAGGPILPPELRNILLVAVAPHLSIDRAIVLAEGSSVRITVNSDIPAVVSVDGQIPITMQEGDQVSVIASDHTIQFVRFQDPGYFYRNLTPHMSQNPSTGNHR